MSKKGIIWTGVILLLLLAVICILTHARKIEDKLTLQAQEKLAAAGISGLSVKFDGRNAVLSGEAESEDLAAKAAALIGGIEGVRKVSNLATLKPQSEVESAQAVKEEPAAETAAADAIAALKNSLLKLVIHFDTNSREITSSASTIVGQISQLLKKYPDVNIDIVGHADSRGTDAYNQKLSLRRASAVKSYLTKSGIDASRLRIQGKGESQPIASNSTKEGMAKNRRVELYVIEEE